MDIVRLSSPLSDISILSRTPTPPPTSLEIARSALASQQHVSEVLTSRVGRVLSLTHQQTEPCGHPHLPLEPPRSYPVTQADWNTRAPANAPRNEISGIALHPAIIPHLP